ncbi:Lipoprotein OS=Castellaniella defragrans OX=75697 GN=HNR28_003119 PE=4 SV=1 [Castellaniella defragrans]
MRWRRWPSCVRARASLPGSRSTSSKTARYQVTERRRLPIDFPAVQQNLFHHAAVCGQTYTFEMVPNQSSFARVVYRPTPSAGWDQSVVLDLVLLQNRSINVKAYSYRPGQLDRVYSMLSAMMKPDSCSTSRSWENKLSD